MSNKEALLNGVGPLGARFTEMTDGISYGRLTVTQIGSYLTLRKPSFSQRDDLGPFSGDKLERAPMIEWWFAQIQVSKTLVYLYVVSLRAPQLFL